MLNEKQFAEYVEYDRVENFAKMNEKTILRSVFKEDLPMRSFLVF